MSADDRQLVPREPERRYVIREGPYSNVNMDPIVIRDAEARILAEAVEPRRVDATADDVVWPEKRVHGTFHRHGRITPAECAALQGRDYHYPTTACWYPDETEDA